MLFKRKENSRLNNVTEDYLIITALHAYILIYVLYLLVYKIYLVVVKLLVKGYIQGSTTFSISAAKQY